MACDGQVVNLEMSCLHMNTKSVCMIMDLLLPPINNPKPWGTRRLSFLDCEDLDLVVVWQTRVHFES